MSATEGEQQLVDGQQVGEEEEQQVDVWPEVVDVELHLPSKQIAFLPSVNVNETLVAIRQALAEFQETAFFTCFKWKFRQIYDHDNQIIPKEIIGDAMEFSELSSYLESNAKKVVFDLVADLYDAKKAKLHVKRVRDIINRQFLLSASPSSYEQNSTVEGENTSAEETKSHEKVSLPKIDQLKDTTIGNFFQESFKTGVSTTALEPIQLPLANVIKSIFVSGWNPVPAYRRLQGDLMYIEVVFVTEGTFYITSTARGFYINRSNRAAFDPTPANNPHFYHSLFDTLSDLSANVKTAWATLCQRSKTWSTTVVPGVLDPLVHGYVNFNGDFNTLPASTWIIPTVEKNTKDMIAIATPGSSYDMLRAQDNLSDLHGVEEFSAPREWNDEIQSIRTLKATDISSKILKARLEHRMITEFTEACKKIVVGISEGLISPLIYSDPSQSDIYVYNGIFFSRAEDTKDAYSIHIGEEAARKSAARDFLNQKLIRSLDIPNMNNILCTIVDYKGIRYVGQSIIPGILNQGENCAQLMYGVLEKGLNATVKTSSLEVFEELAKKLQLTKRKIPIVPFKADDKVTPVEDEGHIDALTQLLQTADVNQTTPIRVDEIGNVEIDTTTNSLPHCGPIEGKLLRGSDGRTYALDMMRLTPRDANYVPVTKGGAARITDEDLSSKTDTSIASTYVLRQELIGIFMQRRVNLARQALLTELAGKERALKKTDEPKKSDSTVSVEDVAKDEDEEDSLQIVKEDKSNEEESQISEEEQEKLALEYREKFSAITPESLGIDINPNVFLNFEADVDPAVVAKDEAAAREMAVFLYDSVLPMLTRQVREGDIAPKDPESMVNLLHRMGVNMRYLGRLADLALEQEREDAELMFQNKQRIHSMPYFWLEFLTVELLSRAAKHMLNNALKTDSAVSSSPSGTVAALLNNFLSLLKEPTEAAPETKENETAVVAAPSAVEAEKKTAKKADKKGKKAAKVVSSSAVADAIGKLEITQVVSPVVATKDAFVTLLVDVLQKKYLYESPILAKQENIEGLDDKAGWRQMQNALLRSRISPLMLIRRICQQCGIVLACKPFDLKNQSTNTQGPFHVNDILGLVPKVKSSEPETYLSEVPEMLSRSSSFLNQGNAVAAFELAQQGLNFITQITGPTHPHALQASEQLTTVLVNSADNKSAAHTVTRTLALTAQVQGLDNSSMIHHHLQLSMLEMELGHYQIAFNHLTTAKYILEVVGGEHHPDMISVFSRLSMLYEKVNDFDSALHSLLRARMFVHDLVNNAGITMAIANLLFRYNRFHEAVHAQKSAYKILKELMSPDDERVVEAKKNLEVYLRAAATAPKAVEYYDAEQAAAAIESDVQGGVFDEAEKDAKKKKSNHKKKAKK